MIVRVLLLPLLTVALVVVLSLVSVTLWGEKPETIEHPTIHIRSAAETPAGIIRQFELPAQPVLRALGVDSAGAGTTTLADLGLTAEEAEGKIRGSLIEYSEAQSKNWRKIGLKFLLWFVFLPLPFFLLLRRRVTPRRRLMLSGLAVVTFGIALGADPSPMGTVKDAVYLLTAHEVVFIPRLVALAVFLGIVVVANKFICSWGCQFGLLQEFLFRLNRGRFDRKGLTRQYKPPFWLSNGIRTGLFVLTAAVGFLWAVDLISFVDPFKIYSPAVLTVAGIGFLVLVLGSALFVYRPWCHFACPFGLVSWLFEKLAIFRIKVDYRACDACDLCVRSCPSTVMEGILKQEKRVVPDCFACGACIDVCPQEAVRFTASRADEGSFEDSQKTRERKRAVRRASPGARQFEA